MSAWRLVFTLLLMSCLLPVRAIEVRDDRGTVVTLPRAPSRIVSVLPSLTEMVCELGACDRLVGVDRYSNHPASVRKLPKVGGGLDPNVESIVALRPDVVLLGTSSAMAGRLQALGQRVVALEPKTHADMRRVFETLGQLLEVDGAARAWARIDSGLDEAAASLPKSGRPIRVYFEVNGAPYAAGETSFIGETLTRLGIRNIVPAAMGPFPKINPEFVVRADPDLILVGDATFAGMSQRPGWHNLRALRGARVCVFNPQESDIIVRPGPRMVEAAQLIVRCVREKLG
jgi:iron complex transport system substrate-binding protein